jgi:hypothetical protein
LGFFPDQFSLAGLLCAIFLEKERGFEEKVEFLFAKKKKDLAGDCCGKGFPVPFGGAAAPGIDAVFFRDARQPKALQESRRETIEKIKLIARNFSWTWSDDSSDCKITTATHSTVSLMPRHLCRPNIDSVCRRLFVFNPTGNAIRKTEMRIWNAAHRHAGFDRHPKRLAHVRWIHAS